MAEGETVKMKFLGPGADEDLTLPLRREGTVQSIIDEVRYLKSVPPNKWVRIICSGRELFFDDPISKVTAKVLHCTLSDAPPQRPVPQRRAGPPPAPPPVEPPPPVDWLDVVDPGTVLMWIFGSILALLWLLFAFYAHMFDRTSVVMLCMMTVAFLIPCALSYLPWPTFLQPQPLPRPPVYADPSMDPALGHSTAVAGTAVHRHAYAGDIPPRPQARVKPGS